MANDFPPLPNNAKAVDFGGSAMPTLPSGAVLEIDPKMLDRKTGAPFKVRAAVSAASTAKDRLATLRNFFPDAQPYDDTNFVFTNPETGLLTLFDEDEGFFSGVTPGDAADVGKEISEVIGGTGGAIFGSTVGPGGTLAGSAGGTALGRNLYEQGVQALIPEVQDTRSMGERFVDTGVTAAMGAGGEVLGQGLNVGAKALAGKMAGLTPAQRVAFQNMEKMGLSPTMGTATGNSTLQAVEQNLIPKMSASGGAVVRDANERYLDEIADAADTTIANNFGSAANREGAGSAVQRGLDNSIDDFNIRRESLESGLTQLIGRDTRVDATPLLALRDRFVQEAQDFPARRGKIDGALAEIDDLLKEVGQVPTQGGGVSYGSLRQARTAIGEKLGRRDATGYAPGSSNYVNEVYGTLKDMIYNQARLTGDDALRLQDELDTLIKTNRDKTSYMNIDQRTKLINNPNPAAVYKTITSGMKDSGFVLTEIRKQMPAAEWKTFVSGVVGNLGKDVEGAFNITRFAKDWGGMNESTKLALFSGDLAGARTNLDKIYSVIKPFQDTAKEMNRSQTGRGVVLTALLGGGATAGIIGQGFEGMLAGVAAAAASEIGGYGMAKLMTNPKFTNWLLTSSSSLTASPKSMPRVIGRLTAIGAAEPEIQEYIDVFTRQLSSIPAQ